MLCEIGSNFWQYSFDSPNREKMLWWERKEYNRIYFKSGRNAIKALARLLTGGGTRVLLPAYTCETVILPFVAEGFEIDYYGINADMSLNVESLFNHIESFKPSVILFHSYFGFDTLSTEKSVIEELHDRGLTIVEDITQSIFSGHFIECADYYVSSLRKFLAIPDGGVLVSKKNLDISDIYPPDEMLARVAIEAFDQKEEYITISKDEELKVRFREGYVRLNQMIMDNEHLRAISPESLRIFASCDINNIRSKRCENYEKLKAVVREISGIKLVIPELLNDTSPLYLPIFVEGDRKALQGYLAENKVYCPVIWPRPSQVECEHEETDYMYEHMLCLPIDQRYDEKEIEKIGLLLKTYSKITR